VTTLLETEVGEDLCKMLRFPSHLDIPYYTGPHAWSHITSCGSVANFEAAWAARSTPPFLSLLFIFYY
jgi:glutamate/tyrosine decarboxylase-like PLP-dependent enzyme